MDRFDEMALTLLEGQSSDARPLRTRLADALRAAATVPEGYVRTGTTDHKLLGTLPMTADGCVIGMNVPVFRTAPQYGTGHYEIASASVLENQDEGNPWYSSVEAAEAAKEAGK